jgi:putative FmdB family regulatory protein
MPIYVYQCQTCETVTEVIQKMSDPPLVKCDEEGCDGKLEKQLTTANPQFRGAGWASDGYSRATMGKLGPKIADVQHDMTEAGAKAAKEGGHHEGRKAVNKYLDKLEKKPGS